ncbi:MAG TPA: glycosyltransferase [Steroidobacteraceae bacterium]|nr:glycosyltransferase [Steroidobacteraceae bacterium]
MTSTHALAAAPLLIWLYLLWCRGRFWRLSQRLPAPPDDVPQRKIAVVIPARDEAALIGDSIGSLLQQNYRGRIDLIVVDDGSTDDTTEVAMRAAAGIGAAARLTVLRGAPLAAGWSGKLWAMSQGIEAASGLNPDYLLLTDADIHHEPDAVAALVAKAEAAQCDLVSCMVELRAQTLAERALVPAFVFFFFMLYPPDWIASRRNRTAGAAGGCMLMRLRALAAIGGLESIRSELIDDCALARATKAAGGSIWLGLTRSARSTRPYGSFAAVGRMISRTAFNQLRHSYLLLAATLAGLCITYVLPPALLLSGDQVSIACGAGAWALMSIAYAPIVRFYRLSAVWTLTLPAVAVFYAAATLHSAMRYALRRGGHWKGRVQDL